MNSVAVLLVRVCAFAAAAVTVWVSLSRPGWWMVAGWLAACTLAACTLIHLAGGVDEP